MRMEVELHWECRTLSEESEEGRGGKVLHKSPNTGTAICKTTCPSLSVNLSRLS
jgi:hypothetical protein